MKNPLVSVIIPVYNVEAYLPACLDSVLNQTYQNFEIVMVNDGSTDRSTQICREYAQKDSRIKLIEQSNGGISAARNAALKIIRGEYITFLDSDDFISSDALELMLSSMLELKAELCICGMVFKNAVRSIAYNCFSEITVFETKELIFEYISTKNITSNVCGKMYRKELFEGIWFPVGRIYEDAFILHELLHKANRAVCIPSNLYIQNIREGSTVRSRFSEKYLDIIDCEETKMKFIQEHYAEWFDLVVCRKYSSIASVMAKILLTDSYREYKDLYRSLNSMLLREYEAVKPFITSNTYVESKYRLAMNHPRLFKIMFYYKGVIQHLKNWVKRFVAKIRG